jgi:hypothetical protein
MGPTSTAGPTVLTSPPTGRCPALPLLLSSLTFGSVFRSSPGYCQARRLSAIPVVALAFGEQAVGVAVLAVLAALGAMFGVGTECAKNTLSPSSIRGLGNIREKSSAKELPQIVAHYVR